MRISVTGTRNRAERMSLLRGFSLIEMLVVLFVIVLMTSFVTLNINSGTGDRVLQNRVESLSAIAAYALDEAQFSGSDFGVLLVNSETEDGEATVTAHWRQRLSEGWREPQRSRDIFQPLEFPPDSLMQLFLEDAEVLALERVASDPASGAQPQWIFTASGETQPGELQLRSRDNGELLWRLRWDPLGRFEQLRGSNAAVEDFDDYAASR